MLAFTLTVPSYIPAQSAKVMSSTAPIRLLAALTTPHCFNCPGSVSWWQCTALHCIALHCTALYYTALHCTALNCTAMHCTDLPMASPLSERVPWLPAVQCRAVQFSVVQCRTLQCSAVKYSKVQCSTVQCSAGYCSAAVQCSAVQYYCHYCITYSNYINCSPVARSRLLCLDISESSELQFQWLCSAGLDKSFTCHFSRLYKTFLAI